MYITFSTGYENLKPLIKNWMMVQAAHSDPASISYAIAFLGDL